MAGGRLEEAKATPAGCFMLWPREMTSLSSQVADFIRLFESGQTIEAMTKYYSTDVVVFDNRELVRAGRAQCVAHERNALEGLEEPPKIRALSQAINEETGEVFIEWIIRATPRGGEPHRLEEVTVQLWDDGQVLRERHYYEGYVDEGWEDHEQTP